MSTTPEVSVLMPVYNTEKYLKEAIDSVLSQTFSDFEFIIIDDASTDASISIIQSYSDPRIRLVCKPKNTGYTSSLNMGLEMARGKYIARMDSDDACLPNRFEKQVDFLNNHPEVICLGTGYQVIDSPAVFHPVCDHKDILVHLIDGSPFGHPTVMMRASVFKGHQGLRYNEQAEPAEDYELWVTLSMMGRLANLPDVLLNYRWHDNQTSKTKARQQQEQGLRIQRKYIEMLTAKRDIADPFLVSEFSSLSAIFGYRRVEKILTRSLKKRFDADPGNYFSFRWRKALRQSVKYLPKPVGNLYTRTMNFIERKRRQLK